MSESFNENYTKFNFYVEDGIEQLRNIEDWSDSKIAYYLRDMAQSLDPKGRKAKKITIDPLKIDDEELLKYPKEIQERIRKIRLTFQQLKKKQSGAV